MLGIKVLFSQTVEVLPLVCRTRQDSLNHSEIKTSHSGKSVEDSKVVSPEKFKTIMEICAYI